MSSTKRLFASPSELRRAGCSRFSISGASTPTSVTPSLRRRAATPSPVLALALRTHVHVSEETELLGGRFGC